MTEDSKMQVLDGMFTECENAKVQTGVEAGYLLETLKKVENMLNASSADTIKDLLGSMKAFLDSGINTLSGIQNDLRNIANDLVKTQEIFRSMGV
jgi:hypothetical protein